MNIYKQLKTPTLEIPFLGHPYIGRVKPLGALTVDVVIIEYAGVAGVKAGVERAGVYIVRRIRRASLYAVAQAQLPVALKFLTTRETDDVAGIPTG